MSHISFKQRAEIQARWLMYKCNLLQLLPTDKNLAELALRFGERLASKIDSKYLTLHKLELKGAK